MKTITIVLGFFILLLYSSVNYREPIHTVTKERVPYYIPLYKIQPHNYPVPRNEYLENYAALCNNILVPLNKWAYENYCDSARLTSGYRDWSHASEHARAKALDIDMHLSPNPITNRDVFEFIRDSLEFNQLIIYKNKETPAHVHVSFDCGNNKNEIWFAWQRRGRGKYRYTRIN